jgi:hypothetical protein
MVHRKVLMPTLNPETPELGLDASEKVAVPLISVQDPVAGNCGLLAAKTVEVLGVQSC